MDLVTAAVNLNLFGRLIYNVLYRWVLTWGAGFEMIGAFAITVVIFTLFLKIATFPFDYWQKSIMRKNTKIMDEMKPHLDKIQKAYANDREKLMIAQRALYKEYKYSTFGACLPMLLTLVIFFVVFGGFNSAIRYHNSVMYDRILIVYNDAFETEKARIEEETGGFHHSFEAATIRHAATAAADSYQPERFLFTKNIFMPDTWAPPIPTAGVFTGRGIGNLNIPADLETYNNSMSVIMERHNTNSAGGRVWNGWLLLPIAAFLLSIVTTILTKPGQQPAMAGQTAEQQKAAAGQAKIMQYMMPLMMGVFAMFYSTAFTLYLLVSSLFTTIFNLIYNFFAKRIDTAEKDYKMTYTIK
jgi:YidC/Oxa1 family membrane protein insertase